MRNCIRLRRIVFVGAVFSLIFFLAFTFSLQSEAPPEWPHPEEMEFEILQPEAREAEKFTLGNGLKIYLMEDRDLPLIKGEATIDAGGIYAPAKKVGLAEMTANLLRTGGSAGIHPDEIDEKLEYLAASIELNGADQMTTASFSTLSENKEEVLELYNDILRDPDFLEERIELQREKLHESIRRRDDHPVRLAAEEFVKRVAEGHPIGWFPTHETVNNIAREDLINFHERYFQPQSVKLAVTGDFEKENMLKKLESTLGTWEGEEVDFPEVPEFEPHPEPKVYHVQQPIEQSIIFIGHPSVYFDSEMYAPLNFANRILGGEGDNRLFREIRSRRGLAYAVGSVLTQGLKYPGFFYSYALTSAPNTGETIESIENEISRIREEEVSQEELEDNRQAILNKAVYRYTSAEEIARRQTMIDFFNLRPGYYERYIEQVQELEKADIKNAAQKEFRPDEAIIMVVGDRNRFDKELEEFGPVEEIEIEF